MRLPIFILTLIFSFLLWNAQFTFLEVAAEAIELLGEPLSFLNSQGGTFVECSDQNKIQCDKNPKCKNDKGQEGECVWLPEGPCTCFVEPDKSEIPKPPVCGDGQFQFLVEECECEIVGIKSCKSSLNLKENEEDCLRCTECKCEVRT